jgi:hypothetical protein
MVTAFDAVAFTKVVGVVHGPVQVRLARHRTRRAHHRCHAMSASSLTAVVQTNFGWHLILVHERSGGAPGPCPASAAAPCGPGCGLCQGTGQVAAS